MSGKKYSRLLILKCNVYDGNNSTSLIFNVFVEKIHYRIYLVTLIILYWLEFLVVLLVVLCVFASIDGN